jgi:hypothetical protein
MRQAEKERLWQEDRKAKAARVEQERQRVDAQRLEQERVAAEERRRQAKAELERRLSSPFIPRHVREKWLGR